MVKYSRKLTKSLVNITLCHEYKKNDIKITKNKRKAFKKTSINIPKKTLRFVSAPLITNLERMEKYSKQYTESNSCGDDMLDQSLSEFKNFQTFGSFVNVL
jgi:hypothetical protein